MSLQAVPAQIHPITGITVIKIYQHTSISMCCGLSIALLTSLYAEARALVLLISWPINPFGSWLHSCPALLDQQNWFNV